MRDSRRLTTDEYKWIGMFLLVVSYLMGDLRRLTTDEYRLTTDERRWIGMFLLIVS
jgi:hypothetical protein